MHSDDSRWRQAPERTFVGGERLDGRQVEVVAQVEAVEVPAVDEQAIVWKNSVASSACATTASPFNDRAASFMVRSMLRWRMASSEAASADPLCVDEVVPHPEEALLLLHGFCGIRSGRSTSSTRTSSAAPGTAPGSLVEGAKHLQQQRDALSACANPFCSGANPCAHTVLRFGHGRLQWEHAKSAHRSCGSARFDATKKGCAPSGSVQLLSICIPG